MWVYLLVPWLWAFSLVTTVIATPVEAVGAENSISAPVPSDLTPSEFAAMKGSYFIKFFSPYCGHCKAFAPKWDAAFEAVGSKSHMKWANINCIENGDLCRAENVLAWPTIRVYQDGQRRYDYSNTGATEEDLKVFALEFAKRGEGALSPAYEKATPELLQELESSHDSNVDPASPVDKAALDSKNQVSGAQGADEANQGVGDSVNAPISVASVVKALGPGDFGPDNNVGRWFVLFVGPDCEECDAMTQKWERHENFARDIPEINWGRVDCADQPALCESEGIDHVPNMRIYQDGSHLYEYDGAKDTMSLRTFLKRAAVLTDFSSFSLTDLGVSAVGFDGKPLPEGAGPNQEPKYMSGPSVPKPNHGKGKPDVADVVKYTLDTLGQPIDDDPGLLIFGESPERHHNFRTWGAPNAQPPAYFAEGAAASFSLGKVKEVKGTELEETVKNSGEPWFINFYSPKCSHCQALAPVFEEFAAKTKDKLNAGAVNCDLNSKLCEAEKITHYPLMKYYRGPVALDEYEGPRTVEGLTNYALKVSKAQIIPIENYDGILQEIQTNFDMNMTTFVYLYDESVMTEDWESLAKVAINIAESGGKLYRSNSQELRDLAGITHRGTAFALVEVVTMPEETKLVWYDFPLSNIPSKIRDSNLVSQWAQRSKWSQLQPLNPIEQSGYAPYIAVKLTSGNKTIAPHQDKEVLEHRAMADVLREFYRERQIQDQDRMRIDRLRQHDEALRQSKFKYALNLMKQKLEAPFIADLAFAYIPLEEWQTVYSKYIDTSYHEIGNVVIVDFYHGLYIDEFNLVPIKDDREVFDDLVEFLHRYEAHDSKAVFNSIRHFKTKMSGVPVAVHRSQKFHAKQLDQNNAWLISVTILTLKVIGGFIAIYVFYRTLIRPWLRAFVEKRRNSASTPSLLPKQE